ncbi:MAG: hypothetical protein LBN93_08340 [Candidatus Symbiothrix sp.]|jgi:hypothetical protein|nr:hypothetical protein [Candidatus Symbiothrix sp.]
MKRLKLVLLVAALLVTANCSLVTVPATAQVAIGGVDAPAVDSGINLLLDGSKGGLLLPKVAITSLTALPDAIVNPTPAPDSPVDPAQLGGLLVYNTTAAVDSGSSANIPVGVYYWDSVALSWKLLAEVS